MHNVVICVDLIKYSPKNNNLWERQ